MAETRTARHSLGVMSTCGRRKAGRAKSDAAKPAISKFSPSGQQSTMPTSILNRDLDQKKSEVVEVVQLAVYRVVPVYDVIDIEPKITGRLHFLGQMIADQKVVLPVLRGILFRDETNQRAIVRVANGFVL